MASSKDVDIHKKGWVSSPDTHNSTLEQLIIRLHSAVYSKVNNHYVRGYRKALEIAIDLIKEDRAKSSVSYIK